MLPEKTDTTDTTPAPRHTPDTPAAPRTPADLLPLARRARADVGSARELAAALLSRGWAARNAARLSGLAVGVVTALSRVRRPGTASGVVADDAAARARRRTDGIAAGRELRA